MKKTIILFVVAFFVISGNFSSVGEDWRQKKQAALMWASFCAEVPPDQLFVRSVAMMQEIGAGYDRDNAVYFHDFSSGNRAGKADNLAEIRFLGMNRVKVRLFPPEEQNRAYLMMNITHTGKRIICRGILSDGSATVRQNY
ncbi:MAG: hypothetical protein ACOYXC_17555 [Candidatus Rifleibacteriota bacterium]